MSNNSVFHWGASGSMPVTLVAVSPNTLVTDLYFSKKPLNLNSKVEYCISLQDFRATFLEKLAQIILTNVSTLSSTVEHVRSLLKEFLDTITGEETVIYLTIPIINAERCIMNYNVNVIQNPRTDLVFKEKMFSTLVHTVVRQRDTIVNISSSQIRDGFINLEDIHCDKHIIYNGVPINPCVLCKYKDKKIGNFCIYYTGGIECLFTASLPAVTNENVDTTRLGAIMSGIPAEDFELVNTVTTMAAKDPNQASLDALIEQAVLSEEELEGTIIEN